MVALKNAAPKPGETVYFEEPIPQAYFMRFVSCSLFNSWYNLKCVGQLILQGTGETLASIPGGHYMVDGLVNELSSNLTQNKNKAIIKLHINTAGSILKVISEQGVSVSHALAALLGTGTRLDLTSYFKKLNTPSAYFIHCDLIDTTKNFLHGKTSDVLAKFDIKGLAYEKVSYYSPPQDVLRECSTDQHINSITLSIKDESGELFDFNGLPLEFVLKINGD